ncbi:MAG TPA: GTPase ObgE [Verrucomicrobiae bacterium]|nr:GTPase ObgE [Verrucomicrobiae bacterium]
MFYDQAKIYVKGGDGGSGAVAFRREKYVPEGGPSGGDGGRGGDIFLIGDEGLWTLADFRYQRHYKADRGEHGQGKNMHGKGADDLRIRIPVGTVVKDSETGEVLADIVYHGQQAVVAKGGRGGRGNARFMTNVNKAPTTSEKGEPGQERWLYLELKVLADVGLVGFPNVGKSTLISRVSAAKPKIADYHFTTLVPNLGVVDLEDGISFVMADIPGLIEGAHTGAGLGHEFLRHTERTRLIIHVLDVSGSEGRDPLEDHRVIMAELEKYNPQLANRPQVIAANKLDIPGAQENLELLKAELGDKYEIFAISAATGEGVRPLVLRVGELLNELRQAEPEPAIIEEPRIVKARPEQRFSINVEDEVFVVSSRELERHVAMTNFETEGGIQRFQNILKAMGVVEALRQAGAAHGSKVRIADLEFDFVD